MDEITLTHSFGNWRLTAEVETHVRDNLGIDLGDRHDVVQRPLDPGYGHMRAPMVESSSVSLTRFQSLAPGLWASATASLNFATETAYRDYYSEEGAIEAGLMYFRGDSFFWAEQRREFISSDRYLTRNTWKSEVGFMQTVSDGEYYGVMLTRTQYPFDVWGTSTSISAFGTRDTRYGPVKGWIAGQRFGERNGLSAAVSFETEF